MNPPLIDHGDRLHHELTRVRRAIGVADLVESVRLMERNEDAVIAQWREFVQRARDDIVPRHGGRMVKSLGDGMLLEFGEVRAGLACLLELRQQMRKLNGESRPFEPLKLRLALHVADVVVDDIDIFGASVNLTARLGSLAEPDGIVASHEAIDELVDGVDAEFEDMGECFLKHIEQPVRAFRLHEALPQAVVSPRLHDAPPAAEVARPKLAVLTPDGSAADLPLRSLLADELSAQLASHSGLDVISRLSIRHAHGLSAQTVVQRVRSDYALSGSCLVLGGRVRVSQELQFCRDAKVIWTHSTTLEVADLIARPAELLATAASGLMEAIEVHETGRVRSLPLPSLASYSLLIGGVRLMHRLSRSDFDRAYDVLETLVARHPRHPDAYAWLAKWHILQMHQGWSADARLSMGMAHDMSRRALDRNDQCAVAMVVSGMVKTYGERKLAEGEALYAEALAHHPNDALAWLLKGTLHAFRGEGDEAVGHTRRALELSPLDPMRYYYDSLAASAEASAGHYDEAIALARRSLAANAMHASTLRILTIAYAMLDRIDEARQVVQRMRTMEPDFSVARFLERSPSAEFAVGRIFAEALARAGVPR